MSLSAYFAGVEVVWLVWGLSLAIVLLGAFRALRRFRLPRWSQLTECEQGVSYSLSYVIVIPIYLLFVCVVFETTFLLLAKVGTLYAAHAGARSAVVWESAQPQSLRDERIQQSVFTAMAPFTGARMADGASPSSSAMSQASDFVLTYKLYSARSAAIQSSIPRPYPRTNAPDATLIQRYLAAASRTTYQVDVDNSTPDGNVKVTVSFKAPLYIPGAARILAPGGGRDYLIQSSATLVNEAPVSADRKLGIDYQSQ